MHWQTGKQNLRLRILALVIAMLALSATPSAAQSAGTLTPLPDKLPPSVEARVGKVELENGLPTNKGIQQLFEIQDFQRAVQLYQWGSPPSARWGGKRPVLANGAKAETDWTVYEDYGPCSGILTPNTVVSYVMAFPDLENGPLVLQYPAGGIAGIVEDFGSFKTAFPRNWISREIYARDFAA